MKLFWLDLETTGLDAVNHGILEIAIAEADLHSPFDIGPIYQRVIQFTNTIELSQFILKMHTDNGLLKECAESPTSLQGVAFDLRQSIPIEAKSEDRPTLAGSSVHFDHTFLAHHIPEISKRFSHRHYDISAVKLFCRSLGMAKVPKAEAHRATDDILESIEHAKICRDWLREHL